MSQQEKDIQIVLKVKNNTNFTQPVEVFSAISNNNFSNNTNSIYTWDLTTENYIGSYNVTILISNTSNSTPIYYSVAIVGNNIQSVVDALNTLNQGLFQYSGTTIYVSNNYYIYGALEVVSTIFTSVWNTNNTSGGSSTSTQVQLPLVSSGTYNFIVNWGDGTQNTITVWNQAQTLHTYAVAGTYTITITGTITGFVFNNTGDRNKLLSISNWGNLNLGNSASYFHGCTNLNLSTVVGVLNLNGTTYLSSMFLNCSSLTTINNINQWNVSAVLDMSNLFTNCILFNDDLSNWNTSSVTNMSTLFSGCTLFNNPLNSWNVSNVTTMGGMFLSANIFNQPLNSWNVSNVIGFNLMFRSATAFNQNIGNWNVISAQNMDSMFYSATAFNQNIGSWNIKNVTNFSNFMFNKTDLDYSATNLNAIYNGWSLLTVVPNLLNVNFGTIKYTIAGQSGKNILTGAPNNWGITDGGI
jgi:surface protein